MSNKKLGNAFETELCNILSAHGFWAHNLAQNSAGQPADIIAARNSKAHLIDCKVCSGKGFALSRMEENQNLSMSLWRECGNGEGWFALKLNDGRIFMVSHNRIERRASMQSSLSIADIEREGQEIDDWMVTAW